MFTDDYLNSSIRIGFPFTKNSTSKFVLFGLYYRIVLISGQFATRFYFCEGTWWRKHNNPESRQLLPEIENLSPFCRWKQSMQFTLEMCRMQNVYCLMENSSDMRFFMMLLSVINVKSSYLVTTNRATPSYGLISNGLVK